MHRQGTSADFDEARSALLRLRQISRPRGATGRLPTRETLKLFIAWKTLGLRRSMPEVFRGDYEPIDLGAGVCAYTRGRGKILVAAAVRPGARVTVPGGWHDVIRWDGLALARR